MRHLNRILRRALAIREKQFGPDHPDLAPLLSNLAAVQQMQRKYAGRRIAV